MAKDVKFDSSGDNCENKTIKKSLSKNLNKAISYLFFEIKKFSPN